jgi:hypothetical protein
MQTLSKNPFKIPSGKPKAGSEKPIAIKPRPRPKAGSNTPVSIRRPQRPSTAPEQAEKENACDTGDVIHEGKHGYYIYVHGEKVFTSHQLNSDGKPTASVRPMLAIDLVGSESDEDDKDSAKDLSQDLKPIQLSFSNSDSLEASL